MLDKFARLVRIVLNYNVSLRTTPFPRSLTIVAIVRTMNLTLNNRVYRGPMKMKSINLTVHSQRLALTLIRTHQWQILVNSQRSRLHFKLRISL